MNRVKYFPLWKTISNSVQRRLLALLVFACVLLAACGGGGGGGGGSGDVVGGTTQDESNTASVSFAVRDGANVPVSGAVVTLGTGNDRRTATTDADGVATFYDVAPGNTQFSVTATGFVGPVESQLNIEARGNPTRADVYLLAVDAWATPRLVVLGTRMIDLANDGSEMTFTADVAVIDSNSEALETLTSAQFSLLQYDCGWGGPRDCASDAAGNATGSIGFTDGNPMDFALQPHVNRRPYIVEVLVEQSAEVDDWSALKFFFTSIGSNDAASLVSVQREGDSEIYTVYGPYKNDGREFLAAIDQLSVIAGDPPSMMGSLVKSIQRVAAAEISGMSEPLRAVVVASSSGQGLTVAEVDIAAAIAKEHGVKVSGVGRENFGYPEIAVRTGGFTVQIDDPRQRAIVFRAMDQLLAGTTPYYRMTFRIEGDPGTFVSGGNAKVMLSVSVPTSIRHHDPYTRLDVAIP